MSKALYMETTKIDPQRTAGEVISELVRAGATSVKTDYASGAVSGLQWVMSVRGANILFDMPVRTEPVFALLNGRRKFNPAINAAQDRQQAARVAWRQLLRWVQAQNAMIETGMVEPAEVYLPYMLNHGTGLTLYQHLCESKFKMLAAPEPMP